jgi:hypothetical protein
MKRRKPKFGPLPRLSRKARASKIKDIANSLDRACNLVAAAWLPAETLSPLIVQAVFRELATELRYRRVFSARADSLGRMKTS